MFKKLLVAVDGSSHSIKAVKVVAELAHQLKLHSDFTCDPGSSLTERDPGNDSRRRSDGIPTGDLEKLL